MRTEYDRKERERINRGWHYVLDLAGRISLDAGPMLKDALRIERKGRGSLILAKGLLLECLAENPTTQSVADLYGKSRGCQLAYILELFNRINLLFRNGVICHLVSIRSLTSKEPFG